MEKVVVFIDKYEALVNHLFGTIKLFIIMNLWLIPVFIVFCGAIILLFALAAKEKDGEEIKKEEKDLDTFQIILLCVSLIIGLGTFFLLDHDMSVGIGPMSPLVVIAVIFFKGLISGSLLFFMINSIYLLIGWMIKSIVQVIKNIQGIIYSVSF